MNARLAAGRPEARAISPAVGFVLVALGIALGALAFWLGAEYLSRARKGGPLHDPNANLRDATPAEPLDAAEREAVELFKKVKPSVVNVDIVQVRRAGWDERLVRTTDRRRVRVHLGR